jgi:shikimate dehydrogenase
MIDSQTELYGVIGNPVRHSLSPILHNGAFRRMGLNAVYLTFEVRNLKEAIEGIRGLDIRGVSVTLPFKTSAIPFLDEVEDVAGKIKAVNTISNEKGVLIGYNTDWWGAMKTLEEKTDLEGKKVLLLGAGGTARAIGFGLKERDCELIISNRSPEKGEALAEELECNHLPLSSLVGMKEGRFDADILINATSVGMFPHDEESPLPKEILKERMIVMDIVYQPLRTKLLREAEEKGCQTIDGLGMLVHQGIAQIEIWTGRRVEVEPIKDDLHRALKEGLTDKGGTLA